MRARAGAVALLAASGLATTAASAAAAPVTMRAEVAPRSVSFGDAFTYVVEARVDGGQIDPDAVEVIADTGAFTSLGSTASRSRGRGGLVVLRLSQRLACLGAGCVPSDGARTVRLPPPSVFTGPTEIRGVPPTVEVTPRVPAAAVRARNAEFRRQTEIPARGTPVSADVLEVVLWVAAGTLVVLAAALCALELRRRTRQARAADRMARALRLLRESALRPADDRRRAADLVARELAARGATPLSGDATELAWSPREPGVSEARSFADDVERAIGVAR
jgi:hypothetical protein